MVSEDDSLLIGAIADGDRDAFTAFYERHVNRVYRFCLARLHDADAAADACQETMIAVWQGANRYGGRGSPTAWLFGIAVRRVQDAWRRVERRPTPVDVTAVERPSEAGELETVEIRLDLAGGLQSLPPEQQESVLLAYYADLSLREIAEITAVPEGTVKSRLYHARKALARLAGGDPGDL